MTDPMYVFKIPYAKESLFMNIYHLLFNNLALLLKVKRLIYIFANFILHNLQYYIYIYISLFVNQSNIIQLK